MKLVWTAAAVLGLGVLTLIGPSVANRDDAGVGNCYSEPETSTPTLCE